MRPPPPMFQERVVEGTAESARNDAGANAAGADPHLLKAVVAAAHGALAARAAEIDTLNVYPVPDGDTGTNMLLTLRSVLEAVSTPPGSKDEAARAVSRAALMGARGNSGVILSQMLRGACDVLGGARALDAATVSAALAGARDKAYATVREPVEGTMLSVIKDAAGAARRVVEKGEKDPLEILGAAAREAHASVRRTPELLAILKEAGVVDAGGLGVAVILDGVLATLGGEKEPHPGYVEGGAAKTAPEGERLRETVAHAAHETWGYCTEFVVGGFSGDEGKFGTGIRELGGSVLVVADDDLVKVHLHTQDPGGALTYAGTFGRLSGVKIEDMEAQTRARGASPPAASKRPAPLGVVAASRGEGSRRLFEAMGAVVVEGGQGANPSAADLARGVERAGAEAVVLLPNNKNIVAAAEQVRELVGVEVHLVPTTSIAGGLAVMVGFDAEGEAEEVVGEMREISASLLCAEVTCAVRAARVGGRDVPEGAYMGFLDGELASVERGVEEAAMELVRKMLEAGADVVTLLRGYGLDGAAVAKMAAKIRDLDPDVEVEVKDGGQPLYPLQMVAE